MIAAGFIIYALGNIGNVAALSLAPQSVISGLNSLVLVGNEV